ncbi:MAG: protein kinase, partial [Proteobacteria bacterium]|nr:protein kinase [Pseudomonadota bacterium]
LARDPAVGRFVALKVLDATCGNDIARRERFRREIDAVLRIDHPHVCRLLAAEVDHTPPYAAMELLPGRSLADLLSADGESQGLIEPRGRLQWVKFSTFFELVAVAVHAVHQVGIVHRDLKPANLMVTPECEPRVLDFPDWRATQNASANSR